MSAILTKSWKIVHDIEIENIIRKEQGFQPYENINYMKKRWIEETYAGMNTSIKSPGYFECDELIAPILAILNAKGYETVWSCAGHYEDRYPEIYISFQPWVYLPNHPDNMTFDESVNTLYYTNLHDYSKENDQMKDGVIYGNFISFYTELIKQLSVIKIWADKLPLAYQSYKNEAIYKFYHEYLYHSSGLKDFRQALLGYDEKTDSYNEEFAEWVKKDFVGKFYFYLLDLIKDPKLNNDDLKFRWSAILYHIQVFEPVRELILASAKENVEHTDNFDYDFDPPYKAVDHFYKVSFEDYYEK